MPLSPEGPCPEAAEKLPGTERPSSLGLRCLSQTLFWSPVVPLSSCASLDRPPNLSDTEP